MIESQYTLIIYIIVQIYFAYRIGKKIYHNKLKYIKQRFFVYVLIPTFLLMNASCFITRIKEEEDASSFGFNFFLFWLIISLFIGMLLISSKAWKIGVRLFAKANSKRVKFSSQANKISDVVTKRLLDKKLFVRFENVDNVRKNLRIEQVSIEIMNEKVGDAINLKILQVTDLHIGAYLPPELAWEIIMLCNSLQSDLVVLTGDFINLDRRLAGACIDVLSHLSAPLGVFGCLGNHEIITETEDYFTKELKRKGIRILRNTYEELELVDSKIYMVGFDYFKSANDYKVLCDIFRRIPPERSIILCHDPSYFPIFAKNNVSVVFSGHTHGGQIKFEVGPAVIAPSLFLSPYLHGHYCIHKSHLYVSRGIGTSGAPIRISCPPELTVCNLNINCVMNL